MTRASLRSLGCLTACGLLLASGLASAQLPTPQPVPRPAPAAAAPVPAAPTLSALSYILVDHRNGQVLAERDADRRVEPASITKVMAEYVFYRELAAGNLALDDMVTISERAWRTPGSRMFVEVNSQVSVKDLLMGIIVQSGNDATVALAEHVAGSEEVFTTMMNEHAQRLGMLNSNFRNATGLPDEDHYTTARDIAILARALIDEFPEYYAWHSVREFTWNGITQHNRNTLLARDPSVDGIKTGHTSSAGFCLLSSAQRGDMRLIAAVFGTASERIRADESQALFNWGFRFFETHRLYAAGQEVARPELWRGLANEVALGVGADVWVTIPRGSYERLSAEMDLPARLLAPIARGETVGQVRIMLGDQLLAQTPLLALEEAPLGGLWKRTADRILLWIKD